MKALKWLDKNAELVAMGVFMMIIVCVMFLQVIMRYVFKASLMWPEEVCRYSFIWLSYVGISYSIRDNSLMKVDILHTLIPKIAPALNLIGDLATFVFMLLMVVPGYQTVMTIKGLSSKSAALSFPMWLVYLALAVGISLGLFRMIQRGVLFFMQKKHKDADAA